MRGFNTSGRFLFPELVKLDFGLAGRVRLMLASYSCIAELNRVCVMVRWRVLVVQVEFVKCECLDAKCLVLGV